MPHSYEVIIIGAGAAGLICAAIAGARGRSVLVLDHAKKIGEKIRISGGGRCNFTNLHTSPTNYLSQNPHFCKSALKQYTQHDFIDLVNKHDIKWHEKRLGQLFCDDSAQQIIDLLLSECADHAAQIQIETSVQNIHQTQSGYGIETNKGNYDCKSLVIASGGLSIPKIGASKFGYDLAKQFKIPVINTKPALVPITFQAETLEHCKSLSGISANAAVQFDSTTFEEGLLFTHRGLSGPSILQISSYWKESHGLTINLDTKHDIYEVLKQNKRESPKQSITKALSHILPSRLAESICEELKASGQLANLNDTTLRSLGDRINKWYVLPSGTEGYRTAEVTLGGVDTNALSSKTMECKNQPNLYFIGEVMDVTGHLGGYNFQWAWSSGYVAGMNA